MIPDYLKQKYPLIDGNVGPNKIASKLSNSWGEKIP